ncbi:MAG: mechanosensitive ion channel MscS [Rickettsiaceae bacterium]|jgi:small-conductance mechanosensitive channel|nr:mechanosensitive ion channel MscS [Rickettsiaceae bacterium]
MMFYIQSLSQEALGASIDFLPNFVGGLVAFAIFYSIHLLSAVIFDNLIAKNEDISNVLSALKKYTGIAILIIGSVTMLGTWGMNITAIVTGLGATAFVLGIACRDCLANVFAGIFVITRKPFSLNDTINVCGAEGKVSRIDLRYTTIESKGARHLIPNAKLLSEPLTILQ